MGSHVAVAYAHHPSTFLERFGGQADARDDGAHTAGGLRVHCGQDFVVVHTGQTPRATIDMALADVERALPGLRELSEAVAVGLGGGAPSETTRFDGWTSHWIHLGPRVDLEQAVAKAMFSTVIEGPMPGIGIDLLSPGAQSE